MKVFNHSKTFDDITPDFLAERKIVLNEKTYSGYKGRIELFSQWLQKESLSEQPIKKITNVEIARFFAFLANERNLDKPTCQKYFVTIRKVLQYAQKTKDITSKELPFDMVVFPAKKGDFSPDLIPKEIFPALTSTMKERDPQLYLAAMVQYYAFIRPRRELRTLKGCDINLKEGYIHVSEMVAKTKVLRYATITKDLYDIMIEYGIDKMDPQLYVFGKKSKFSSKPIGVNCFSYRFNKLREEFKLSNKVKFYSFKHTGITDMLNAGVPLNAVKDQAGHVRLSSTQHYAKKYSGKTNPTLRNYSRTPNP